MVLGLKPPFSQWSHTPPGGPPRRTVTAKHWNAAALSTHWIPPRPLFKKVKSNHDEGETREQQGTGRPTPDAGPTGWSDPKSHSNAPLSLAPGGILESGSGSILAGDNVAGAWMIAGKVEQFLQETAPEYDGWVWAGSWWSEGKERRCSLAG